MLRDVSHDGACGADTTPLRGDTTMPGRTGRVAPRTRRVASPAQRASWLAFGEAAA
jgi:hypothetical protein